MSETTDDNEAFWKKRGLSAFREQYLDYREGFRDVPPSLDNLNDEERRKAQQWIASIITARGIDPSLARPPTVDLMDLMKKTIQLDASQQRAYDKIQEWLKHRPKQTLSVGGYAGTGKALAFDQPVQTPEGPRPIADLKVGDFVLGENGRPTRVTGVFPQGRRQAYRVTFRDRSSIECDIEHLWHAWTQKLRSKKRPPKTLTLKEIVKKGLRFPSGCYRFCIPLCKPVRYSRKKLPVHPYLLGLLIGDGTNLGRTPTLCTPDSDRQLVHWAQELLFEGMEVRENRSPSCPQYRFVDPTQRGNRLTTKFRRLNLDVLSPERFIPEVFLLGDEEQRWAVLRGLMDTDGSCCKNRTSFSTMSPRLAKDIVRLVQSLGGTAIPQQQNRGEWHVNIKTFKCPFQLLRKANRWRPSTKNPPSRYIIDVQRTRVCKHICIKVAASDGLFLAKDFIVTHNTTLISKLIEPGVTVIAYTGKAVNVLKTKGIKAFTFHQLLYEYRGNVKGQPIFTRKEGTLDASLVIVDEASMVSTKLAMDLLSHGIPVLWIGDHGQLEPVGGGSTNYVRNPEILLETIHRQAHGSPIIDFAHHVREGNDPFRYESNDVVRVLEEGDDVVEDMVPDVVLVGTNHRRLKLNAMMRKNPELPEPGEPLVILKNNYHYGVFNGQIVKVVDVLDVTETRLQLVVHDGTREIEASFWADQFGAMELTEDPRAKHHLLADFGYALTAHKSQGSEWDYVLVYEGEPKGPRWQYTAATRAAKKLIYVPAGKDWTKVKSPGVHKMRLREKAKPMPKFAVSGLELLKQRVKKGGET